MTAEAPRLEDEALSPRTRVLYAVEKDEEDLKSSLQRQLGEARIGRQDLTASLERTDERVRSMQKSIEGMKLDDTGSAASDTVSTTHAPSQIQLLQAQLKQQEESLKKLKFELEMEQGHVNILRHENQILRQSAVNMNMLAEQEEEYITNTLLKRIAGLKKEKGELLLQVEQEEEYLTNTLQRKLNQLQKEKIDMENALEQEQEFIVNRLQKQLDALQQQQNGGFGSGHSSVPRSRTSSFSGSQPLDSSMGGRSGPMAIPASPGQASKRYLLGQSPSSAEQPSYWHAENLKSENMAYKRRCTELENDCMAKIEQCNRYRSELRELRRQCSLSTEDIEGDEPLPLIFRGTLPSPGIGPRRTGSSNSQASELHKMLGSQSSPIGSLSSSATSASTLGLGSGIPSNVLPDTLPAPPRGLLSRAKRLSSDAAHQQRPHTGGSS
ncbi:hypothetical protein BZG36_03719 [Bifiguratus adelaidae]|uniref:Coiled-coil domain-containing protein 6 n=1 Tax=Bifiguratus adelaidae TaxID=1938954 RepID=A0A261XZ73_9FUNG|nr:hypothetical protein BZG36_03719 [Bifiguratus adelaidae]